jgi:hypothetical protein
LGVVLGGEVFLAIFGGCFFGSLDKDCPNIRTLAPFLASSKCGGDLIFQGLFYFILFY